MRQQECVILVVGISGSVADDTVAVVLAAEVWTIPKAASWNTWAGVTLPQEPPTVTQTGIQETTR
jgi:hypothetical protein